VSILLIVGLAGFFLPNLFYPVLLASMSKLKYFLGFAGPEPTALSDEQLPTVSFVISAYNEEGVLQVKLDNTLLIDYPSEKFEVLVLSDASGDKTDQIAKGYSDRGVHLLRSETRVGKSENLSKFVPLARGEIIVFSDANSIYESDAVRRLVMHFTDPRVGYVVGAQRYRSGRKGQYFDSENQYWEIELKIKEWESNLSSVVGADGAIFASRKSLFEPIHASDINDFLGPLKLVSLGYRGVFEPQAVCIESPVSSLRRNFFRKVRIITRSLQAIGKVPMVLLPWKTGWFSVQVWLHKVLRWFSPIFLLLIFLGAWVDFEQGKVHGQVLLGAMLTWVFIASLYVIHPLRRIPFVSTACYALVMNVAAMVALVLALSGRSINTWKPDR